MNDKYKIIPVKTIYLEIVSRPENNLIGFPDNIRIEQISKPTLRFYKFLWNSIGDDWGWCSRKIMSDEEIIKIIHNELVEVFCLYHQYSPAGFLEIDKRDEQNVEIAYFGLFFEFIGKGIGKPFLSFAIKKAFENDPKRIWLHTSEYDSPQALALYQKFGFNIYETKIIQENYPIKFLEKVNKSI